MAQPNGKKDIPTRKDIEQFLENIKIRSPFDDSEISKKFYKNYSKIHTIVIWKSLLSNEDFSKNFGDLSKIDSIISDVIQSLLCWSLSLHKPSTMLLRSASESALIYLYDVIKKSDDGTDENNIRFADKIASVLSHHKSAPAFHKQLVDLKSQYSNNSKIVHSNHPDFENLGSHFTLIMSFHKKRSDICITAILKLIQTLNNLFFYLFHTKTSLAHHRDRDLLAESVPKQLKKEIFDAI